MQKNSDVIKRHIIDAIKALILKSKQTEQHTPPENQPVNEPDSAITVDHAADLLDTPSDAADLLDTPSDTEAKLAYVAGMADTMTKYGFSLLDLAGAVPGLGGFLHGVVSPAEGASRAETALLGGGGSLTGAILAALAGAGLTSRMEGEGDDRQIVFNPAAALGAAALGGIVGNKIGRWMAKRKSSNRNTEELKKLIMELKDGGDQRNITINLVSDKSGKPEVTNG